MMDNYLILGGSGFIGANLAKFFLSQGHNVTVFDLKAPVNQVDGIHYIEGDFFDEKCLERIIKGQDVIIHAISTINPGNSNERFLQGYEKDLVQTVKLCKLLINTDVKLVFLSSGGTVYGDQNIIPIKETNLPCPINHYGSVKLCIENILRACNKQFNTKFLMARIANPYGPGQDYHKGVGFIDAALKKAINKEAIEIWGDGETVRDYIYISDVCKMIYSLCKYDGNEDTFNLSSGKGVSQNEIISIITEIGLKPDVVYKPARTVDVKRIVLDNSRIKSFYNDKITDIRTGIEQYLNYLINNQEMKI